MNYLKRALFFVIFVNLPTAALSQEGYSSSAPSMPATIYQRAFTLHTSQKACEKSPEIESIKLFLPSYTMYIGERLHTTDLNNSIASDLIIEAYDSAGNFVSGVPVYITAYSTGRTSDFDPGILYRDGSMEYWVAKKLGKFELFVRWLCNNSRNANIFDTVSVEVIKGSRSP